MSKKDLIDEILSIELDMFRRVPVLGSKCQDDLEAFRINRESQFETWSERTLECYLSDLKEALKQRRNLMTQKYLKIEIARDGSFPCTNLNPIIDKIMEEEENWFREFKKKYPHILKENEEIICGVPLWLIYLRAELETYSDETLESLYQDILEAKAKGKNLVEETYRKLFQKLGYTSLEEVMEFRKRRNKFETLSR